MKKVINKFIATVISISVCGFGMVNAKEQDKIKTYNKRKIGSKIVPFGTSGLVTVLLYKLLTRSDKNLKSKPNNSIHSCNITTENTQTLIGTEATGTDDHYKKLFKENDINENIIELLQKMCFLQIDNYDKWTEFLVKLNFKDTRTRDQYITREFFNNVYIEVCTPNPSDPQRLNNTYECYLQTGAPDDCKNEFLEKLKKINTFFRESGLTKNIDKFYMQALNLPVYSKEQQQRRLDIEQKRIIQSTHAVSVVSNTPIIQVQQTLQDDPNYQYSKDFIDLYNSDLNQKKELILHPDLFKKRYYSDAYSKIDIKKVLAYLGFQNLPNSLDCDWYETNINNIHQAVRAIFAKWFLNATYGQSETSVIGYAFDGDSSWGSIFDQIITSGRVVSVFEDFIKFLYDFETKSVQLGFNSYSDIEKFSGNDFEKKHFKELWEELMLLWGSLTGGCYNQFISAINYVLTRYSNYLSVPPEDSESIFSSFSTELCKHHAETLVREYVDRSMSQEALNIWKAEVNRTYRTVIYNFLNIKTPLKVYDGRNFGDESIRMFNIVESLTKNLTVKSLHDFIKTQLRTGIFNFVYKKQIVQEFSKYTFNDGTDKDILKKLYGQNLFDDLKVLYCWMKKHNTADEERSEIDVFQCNMLSDVVGGFDKNNYETSYECGFKDLPCFYEIKVPVGKLSAFYSEAVNYECTHIEDEEGNDTSTVIAGKENLDKFFSDLPCEDVDNDENIIDKKFPLAFIFKLKHEGFIDFYMSN